MKLRVGLFFGGMSVEHEVSVISGIQAYHAFDKDKYEVIPIYITKDNKLYMGKGIADISEYKDIPALLSNSQRVILVNDNNRSQLIRYPMKKFRDNCLGCIDVAFPVVHGTNVEDGTLQGYFKMLSIPYVGSDVMSSAVCMDKYAMKYLLKANGIPVLDGLSIDMSDYRTDPDKIIELIEKSYNYPVIVKPINSGSSVGIMIASDSEKLMSALDYAFNFALKIVVEKAIVNLKEINCSVIGDHSFAEASECEEPINSNQILSYDDKYMSDDNNSKLNASKSGMASLKRKIPADISAEVREYIRELAIKVFHILNCNGVVRIDFMIDQETHEVWVNEINTIPGSLSFYLWQPMGLEYPELLDRMIELTLKREREINQISYSFDSNLLLDTKLSGTKGKS